MPTHHHPAEPAPMNNLKIIIIYVVCEAMYMQYKKETGPSKKKKPPYLFRYAIDDGTEGVFSEGNLTLIA